MELIRHLQEWHRADIYQELLATTDKTQSPLTVNSILRTMEYGTIANRPSGYQPYRDLIATVGGAAFVEGMAYLFSHDPSRTTDAVQTVEECFNEQPFPRYFVALCYAILHRQLIPQDQWSACPSSLRTDLAEALWQNIADTGNLLAYPSAMVTVLTDQFSISDLVTRSLPLIADDRPTANTVGDILLNQLMLEDELLLDDLIKDIRQAIHTESDPAKAKKYKAYLRERSPSPLGSIVNLMPWKK